MSLPKFRIFALGDSAITVEFGNLISPELNDRAIAVSEYFTADPFPGFIEAVPAYASVSIFFDPVETIKAFPFASTAHGAVCKLAIDVLNSTDGSPRSEARKIEIPVDFSGDAAPDLTHVAERAGLGADEVIKIFTSTEYRVYMLGFLPGFSYMAKVDNRIATPRKETPRTFVPKGSVGIAGSQTGIYSLDSPGGWQIIGRTDVELFTLDPDDPCYLNPGDVVTFIPTK